MRNSDEFRYFVWPFVRSVFTAMKYALWLLVLCSVVAMTPDSSAQWWGYGGYGGYSYATTPGMGYAIGMSDMVRSAGMATLATSQAASTFEDARSKNFDNRIKYAQTYMELQRMQASYRDELRAQREANRKPPLTSEQLYRIAQQGVPKPLSVNELDPVTGQIAWPVLLRDEAYTSYREAAEDFYTGRATNPSDFTYESYINFQHATADCLALLKSRLKEYKADDYIRAKKFIDSLAHEAKKS